MPFDDPTQPWKPPYQPTPQPANLKEWLKLLKWIWKEWRTGKPKPEYPQCDRCGGPLEVIGFKEGKPIWGCQQCN